MARSHPSTCIPCAEASVTVFLGLDKALEILDSVDTSTSGALEDQSDEFQSGDKAAFKAFFGNLLTVMKSVESKAKVEPTDRAPSTPKTPDQPIPPLDSGKTGERFASNVTGSSEGKPEESTRQLASEFLACVLGVLLNDGRTIKWSKSPHTLRLSQKYIVHLQGTARLMISSTSKRMPFELGAKTIMPINDGGLDVTYTNEKRKVVSWKGGIPFLSIEVSVPSPPL